MCKVCDEGIEVFVLSSNPHPHVSGLAGIVMDERLAKIIAEYYPGVASRRTRIGREEPPASLPLHDDRHEVPFE